MDTLWPVVTLILGWILSEASQRMRSRSAVRIATGLALAELIEVLHYSRSMEQVLKLMRERTDIPLDQKSDVLAQVSGIIPPDPELPARFASAINGIAGTHPILAFRLRSKDQIPLMITRWRAMLLADPPSKDDAEEAEAVVSRIAIKSLEDGCLELAFSHGFVTWFKTKRYLESSLRMPPEYMAVLDKHMPIRR